MSLPTVRCHISQAVFHDFNECPVITLCTNRKSLCEGKKFRQCEEMDEIIIELKITPNYAR